MQVERGRYYLLTADDEYFLGKVTGDTIRGSAMFEMRSRYGCGSGMLSVTHAVCEISEDEYLKADKMVTYYQKVLAHLIDNVAESHIPKKKR